MVEVGEEISRFPLWTVQQMIEFCDTVLEGESLKEPEHMGDGRTRKGRVANEMRKILLGIRRSRTELTNGRDNS